MTNITKIKDHYDLHNSIQEILPKLQTTEWTALRKAIIRKQDPFSRQARLDIKLYEADQKRQEREEKKRAKELEAEAKRQEKELAARMKVAKTFDEKCHVLYFYVNGLSLQSDGVKEYLEDRPHLFNAFARNIGLGVGNLPKWWRGLVSHEALEAKRDRVFDACCKNRLCLATFYDSPDLFNTLEHFHNMQLSGELLLHYALNYKIDYKTFKKMCDCLRQVHVTTKVENQILGTGAQTVRPPLHWKVTYEMNVSELEDVGVIEVM